MSVPHVLLLRGVNVGKHQLPMKDLAALVAEAGASDVRTYIQSGNVVCRLDPAAAPALQRDVAARIEARFGFPAPVVVRSGAELAAVHAGNPFLAEPVPAEAGAPVDEKHLHVLFLADVPAPERAARLDPDRSPGDRFRLVGRDLYLHLPNGVARSKLTNDWLDRTLGTVSTGRNWRTVTTLLAMASA